MPPRSPLPQRHGLDAAWVRTPDADRRAPASWTTIGAWLRDRFPEHVDVEALLARTEFVYEDGVVVRDEDPYRPHTFVFFHRELRDEPPVPGEIRIVHRDERLLVVDKPPFLSTIPRGRHVTESAVVRLRQQLGLPELSPLHRLDRVTSGLLVLATERRWRGRYQLLFQDRQVTKVYRALAPYRPELERPVRVRNHLRKRFGVLQAEVVEGAEPNAETLVQLETRLDDDVAVYRLAPATGKTHQLRVHLNGLGAPIIGDPLYPVELDVPVDDFSRPLQLLAAELSFVDPVDGRPRSFTSTRSLPLLGEGDGGHTADR